MNARHLIPAACYALSHSVLAATCAVSGSGVPFGSYAPTANSAVTSVGAVTVTCSSTTSTLVSYSIAMSAGSGSFASRNLNSGSYTLHYNLYADNARTAVWGDGTLGTTTVSDSYSIALIPIIKTYTVYGTIPAGQTAVGAGTYADTVVLTLTF